ncbi:hypothetical protein NHQ30_008550 [Ciborinia camelliae]|nr:hypothetical protein NHQ30_008550 [Ciborinia camelliae]
MRGFQTIMPNSTSSVASIPIFQIREITTPIDFALVIELQASCMGADGDGDGDENGSIMAEKEEVRGGKGVERKEECGKEDAIKDLIVRQWWRHCVDPCSHWIAAYEGDKIVGGANFRIVREGKEEEDQKIDSWLLEKGEVRREMTEGLMEISKGIRETRGAHVAVVVVFTESSRSGHGIGNMLIEWVTNKAAELGLDVFVEESEKGVSLYKNYGFDVLRRVVRPERKEEGELVSDGKIEKEWTDLQIGETCSEEYIDEGIGGLMAFSHQHWDKKFQTQFVQVGQYQDSNLNIRNCGTKKSIRRNLLLVLCKKKLLKVAREVVKIEELIQHAVPASKGTFYRFPLLPKEVQVLIWKWYGRINAETPNVIRIYRAVERELTEGPLEMENQSTEQLVAITSFQNVSYKIPPIFFICVLSREAGEDLYKKEFKKIPMGDRDEQLTYFNEDKDIVHFEDCFVFQEWRYNRETDSEFTNSGPHPIYLPCAQEAITRRINIRHLVVNGSKHTGFMWKLLGRFYDCETIIVATKKPTNSLGFMRSAHFREDRRRLQQNRDMLCLFWNNEREGPFVREDYRGKPIRPAVAYPSWDPAERTISNPTLLFWRLEKLSRDWNSKHPAIRRAQFVFEKETQISFPNDFKFSPIHLCQFEHPWKTYVG